MTKWDKILIASILLLSFVSIGILTYYQSQVDILYGVIEVNGEEYKRINLSEVDRPIQLRWKMAMNII